MSANTFLLKRRESGKKINAFWVEKGRKDLSEVVFLQVSLISPLHIIMDLKNNHSCVRFQSVSTKINKFYWFVNW